MKRLQAIFLILLTLAGCGRSQEEQALQQGYAIRLIEQWPNGNPSVIKEYKDDLNYSIKNYNKAGQLIIYEEFTNDTLNGNTIKYYTSGKKSFEGRFFNGRMDGEVKKWYLSGALESIANYDRGTLLNKKNYYENGQLIADVPVTNGKLSSHSIYYYPTGEVEKEGTFENNLKSGIWIYYDELGNVLYKELFENGKLIEVIEE